MKKSDTLIKKEQDLINMSFFIFNMSFFISFLVIAIILLVLSSFFTNMYVSIFVLSCSVLFFLLTIGSLISVFFMRDN